MITPSFCTTPLTVAAMQVAEAAHAGQVRKVSGVPYIGHPVAVASIVAMAGGSEAQIAAALLHDVKEDCEPHYWKLVGELDIAVKNIVISCSEKKFDSFGKKRSWMDRKQSYLLCMHNPVYVQDNALLVIAADKLHNVSDTIDGLKASGKESLKAFGAGAFEIGWYYSSMLNALKARLAELDHDEAKKLNNVLYLLDEQTRTLLRMLAPITTDHADSLDKSDGSTRRTVDQMDGEQVAMVFNRLYSPENKLTGIFHRILPALRALESDGACAPEDENYSICIKYLMGVCFCEVVTTGTFIVERGSDSIEVFRRLWLKLEFGSGAYYELDRIEQYGSNAVLRESDIPF